jgi:hypothetical protein
VAPYLIRAASRLVCIGAARPIASVRMRRTGRSESRDMLPAGLAPGRGLARLGAKTRRAGDAAAPPPTSWMVPPSAGSVALNTTLPRPLRRVRGARDGATASAAQAGLPAHSG